MSPNTAVNTNQKPAQATVIPTNNPDEYRLAFLAHPAKRILERQRLARLAKMAKKKDKS